jgi:RimJ/RimL family protein N-acetyltransferase
MRSSHPRTFSLVFFLLFAYIVFNGDFKIRTLDILGMMKNWIYRSDKDQVPGLPLSSPRLKVRRFSLADEITRQGWAKFSDPYLSKYNFQPHNPLINKATFRRLSDRLRLGVENEHGHLIGYISLKPIARDPAALEMGVCFAADEVGKGNGQEALRMVLPWCRGILNAHKVVLEVDQVNERAYRLYRRLGFTKVGEAWKEEDHPELIAHFRRNGTIPGFRWNNQRLEVLSWVMEWNCTMPADCI